jgi:C-terminal processing protease CtpA/Prc
MWTQVVSLEPVQPHYVGKVVILVDEDSESQSEYTAMALQAVPNVITVGSQTSGADGNVSPISLPGGINTQISGFGIFYPEKQPTQGIGVRIDVKVEPTIAGLRSGRDEVLEEAIRQILGKDVPPDHIRQLAKP